MPRPKTKNELLAQSQKNLDRLKDLISSLPPTDQNNNFKNPGLNKNISDVISHLHHWHLMMLDWYEVGMKGEKPHIPAEGYNWRTLPALNVEIQKMYNSLTLEESMKNFAVSHEKVMDLIHSHSEEELFERKRYPWTGNNAIAGYLVGAASSHYDWAYKLIKKNTK